MPGKRKLNAYMVAMHKARKSGAKSFVYKGNRYVRVKLKTGLISYKKGVAKGGAMTAAGKSVAKATKPLGRDISSAARKGTNAVVTHGPTAIKYGKVAYKVGKKVHSAVSAMSEAADSVPTGGRVRRKRRRR